MLPLSESTDLHRPVPPRGGFLAKVILAVAASDAHVVANHLIAFHLRQLGYEVVNLGACTPVSELVACFAEHPDALAMLVGSVNGHAYEDLIPLRDAKSRGLITCPVVVGGNLSVGSAKTGREASAIRTLGVDYVLSDIDEAVILLDRLRAARAERFGPRDYAATSALVGA